MCIHIVLLLAEPPLPTTDPRTSNFKLTRIACIACVRNGRVDASARTLTTHPLRMRLVLSLAACLGTTATFFSTNRRVTTPPVPSPLRTALCIDDG